MPRVGRAIRPPGDEPGRPSHFRPDRVQDRPTDPGEPWPYYPDRRAVFSCSDGRPDGRGGLSRLPLETSQMKNAKRLIVHHSFPVLTQFSLSPSLTTQKKLNHRSRVIPHARELGRTKLSSGPSTSHKFVAGGDNAVIILMIRQTRLV